MLSSFSCLGARDALQLRSGIHSIVLLPLTALLLHNEGGCIKKSHSWPQLLLLPSMVRVRAGSHTWGIAALLREGTSLIVEFH